MPNRRTIYWSGALIVVIIAALLWWWYAVISGKQHTIDAAATARGFSSATPSFGGLGGSMRDNLVGLFTSPFGNTPATTTAKEAARPALFRTSAVPSEGLFSLLYAGSNNEDILFVDRPTGNIFALPLAGGEARRITNTLVPHVYEAIWIDADSLVIRHSNDGGVTLLTFLGTIAPATSSTTNILTGSYIDDVVVAVAARPGGEEPSLFYVARTPEGAVGIISESDGSHPKRVWSSPLIGWNVAWIADDRIVLAQKAAEGIVGSVYTLSPKTGRVSLVVGNKEGLVALPHPTEDAVVYSVSQNQKTKLYARVGTTVREIPVSTTADKCVWAHGEPIRAWCAVPDTIPPLAFPDAWYRGEVALSDRWFSIDPVDASAELFMDPVETFGQQVDAEKPLLSVDGKHILFTDKITGTGWVLSLPL